MFFGEGIVVWVFVTCFLATVVVGFTAWKRICGDLNRALVTSKKITLYPPPLGSFSETVINSNLLVYSYKLLVQHRRYYPSSPLRRIYATAALCSIPFVIGIMLTIR